MLTPPTQHDLDAFYNNPEIAMLADEEAWTISDKDKRPIDLKFLQKEGKIIGAKYHTGECFMSLNELRSYIPNAANHTLALSVHAHNFMVLDIEPSCPPEIAQNFIETLPWTYAEVSMSGNGYHLILPVPDNFAEFPFAADKTKLQEEHKYYEIIIDHLITFTRKSIPSHPQSPGPTSESRAAWMNLYASLAEKAQERQETAFDISANRPKTPHHDFFVSKALERIESRPYPKQPAEFNNDMSRWEFGALSYIQLKVRDTLYNFAPTLGFDPMSYTNEMITWMVFDVASVVIPYRSKHDETRNGLPYLLARCEQNVATSPHARSQG